MDSFPYTKIISTEESGDYGEKPNEKTEYLTLMEEIFLLSIKDDGCYLYYCDILSHGLRVCMLIELALRGRIQLEPLKSSKQRLEKRKIVVIDKSPTNDGLLDEALLKISESLEADTVINWLELLNGESWNPRNFKYQICNVRTRLSERLSEKGILHISSINTQLCTITLTAKVEPEAKKNLLSRMHHLLLRNWRTFGDLDPRDFALIIVAHEVEIMESILSKLNSKDQEIALSKIKMLECIDPDFESKKYAKVSSESNLEDNVRQIICACFYAMYN